MIAGFKTPELGGKPDYLDILGANFYSTNEWNVDDGRKLVWNQVPRDASWRPLSLLLSDIWERYRRPLFLAETSDVGMGRAPWITQIGGEILLARTNGIPVSGICLYPIIDRYDWGNPEHWHNSGLWDYTRMESGVLHRMLNSRYAESLRAVQAELALIGCL